MENICFCPVIRTAFICSIQNMRNDTTDVTLQMMSTAI